MADHQAIVVVVGSTVIAVGALLVVFQRLADGRHAGLIVEALGVVPAQSAIDVALACSCRHHRRDSDVAMWKT